MNLLAICAVTIATIGATKLGWTALKPLREEVAGRQQDRAQVRLALHAQHVPELRQALASQDADYVRRKAPGAIERHSPEGRANRSVQVEAEMARSGSAAGDDYPLVAKRSPVDPG